MTHEDTMFHERDPELVQWGSRLTPEQREWQIAKLLPAILAALENAADATNAVDGKDVAGKPPR
ncbi:MAG: hypothetical protein M3Q71_23065 [Chloroflexota bacterium]|nr:hypothetical protein [Chloroflexota bacterium]